MANNGIRISLVMAARNDDYGGNFLNRMRTSVRTLRDLADKYHASFELVVVEYNPPENEGSLMKALAIPSTASIQIRYVQVPRAFHASISEGSKNPFFEYVAKNIGIRRALGDYIISLNPDIILSEGLVAFLASGELDPGFFYRINRNDLSIRGFDDAMPTAEVLNKASRNTTRIWTNHSLFYVSFGRWVKRFLKKPRPRNFVMCPVFNPIRRLGSKDRVHDAAAGDFIMAHRNAWATVRGFDQGPFNTYVDGYNAHMFFCAGFTQKVLPFPIYHINHQIVATTTRALLSVDAYRLDTAKMVETKIPYKTYAENWGYPENTFTEYKV